MWRNMRAHFGILAELFEFLWRRKLYWLIPMIITLAVFAVFILLAANPGTRPFIYTLF
jgi:hypothetical protein